MITKCLCCGKRFDVEPSWKGQTAACDSCGKDFTVKKYIECPKCAQLTPENGDKCESCNASIIIKMRIPTQYKEPSMPPSAHKYESSCSPSINQDSDKIALESVSGAMRFWIRIAATLILFGVAVESIKFGLYLIDKDEGLLTKNMEYIVSYSFMILLCSFIAIMGAVKMHDSAYAKAKIAYNTFYKIIFVAFLFMCLLGMIGIGSALLAREEPMEKQIGQGVAIIINIYTFFVAWQLYRARAFAQAETIK